LWHAKIRSINQAVGLLDRASSSLNEKFWHLPVLMGNFGSIPSWVKQNTFKLGTLFAILNVLE